MIELMKTLLGRLPPRLRSAVRMGTARQFREPFSRIARRATEEAVVPFSRELGPNWQQRSRPGLRRALAPLTQPSRVRSHEHERAVDRRERDASRVAG
jgi:hypothetical protein